jgi:spermidine synthase
VQPRAGESWSIYEIDPELVRISTESGLFRTMPTCGPDMRVVVGDAQLTLTDAREPFDLMILDAYSSDNIPVHLLTREAMRLYESLLTPHGKIVMNITNRNMDLTDIVSSSAHAVGLAVRHKRDGSGPDFSTTFMPLRISPRWRETKRTSVHSSPKTDGARPPPIHPFALGPRTTRTC